MSAQGELFRAHAHIRPRRANFFAHEAQQHSDIETNNTTARPQTATIETTITSATENHAKNTHFSTAKATAVSIGARPARTKAMVVSTPRTDERAKATAVSIGARPARAKVMAVSTPRTDERAKATGVSRERFVMPVGGGWASPQHPWAISVTNVVKPEQFEPPCECSCYKRRQSASKNLDSQRKSPRIDDVCNNGSEIHTKNTSD